jgi:uncharacterized membrane protein (UPF0127 family)
VILSSPIFKVASLVLVALATISAPDETALALQDDPECPRWRRAFAGMSSATLVVHTSAGRRIRLPAKVATTDEARQAGFQCATADEIRRTVIVFDFDREVLGGFHMQNVPAPLDIAFVKGSGRIFSILRMDPGPSAQYGPLGMYRYAIEARAGFFKDRGISSGDEAVLLESR